MPDFLSTASAWLDTVCREQISQQVRIIVGAAKSELIPATIGQTDFESVDDDNIVERTQARDYLIAVSDYVVNGKRIEPCRGHKVEEAGRHYVVVALGDEPEVRYSDADQRMWRIHTKLSCD